MLAVVKKPRTKKPTLEIRGNIPSWIISRLKKEYGKQLKITDDEDELINIIQTDWYSKISKKTTPGHALRIYRENSGLSQEALGKKLGNVPRQNVSAMEKGRRGISKEMAKSLSKVLKAPVERFI